MPLPHHVSNIIRPSNYSSGPAAPPGEWPRPHPPRYAVDVAIGRRLAVIGARPAWRQRPLSPWPGYHLMAQSLLQPVRDRGGDCEVPPGHCVLSPARNVGVGIGSKGARGSEHAGLRKRVKEKLKTHRCSFRAMYE